MFLLNNLPLALDVPFFHNGINYPANWLRLASPDERAAIGITEAPEPEQYDQRFYWGPANPKDHQRLMDYWCEQVRASANAILQRTDWMAIRFSDNGTPVPLDVSTHRQSVRDFCSARISEIQATTDTQELASLVTGSTFYAWPEQ